MRTKTLQLAVAALLLATSAAAERSDREKEIVVGADRLTADDANRTSTFEGSVVVTQGTMRMTASKVTVKEDAQRHKFYVASGSPVTFRQKRDKVDEWVEGFAERAEFDDRNDVLKLYTRARVKSNQNELAGDFISYDMKREVAEVSGAPPGKAAAPDSRVKVIILPPKRSPEADDKKAAPGVSLKSDPGKP
ncbi:MAG: lipopolysaccharide transport periplasmic protein LptA [Pseudomonadota bacterium]|nr:lipopolysaccharide transport periplasmic protein LptA [Pseudomonadota bacterium]